MSKRKYKYLTHVIRIGSNGASESDEHCNSADLTKHFAEGWQVKKHDIAVKRTMVVHSWIMFKDEPEEAEKPKSENMAITTYGPSEKFFKHHVDALKKDVVITPASDEPTPEPMTFEQAVKAGWSGEELKAFGNQIAVRNAVEHYKATIKPFTPSHTFALPHPYTPINQDETIVILERAS